MPTRQQHTQDDDRSQHKLNVRSSEICVDYLSYRFDEMDLAASWQLITKQKKDIVDGIRLENASWRTWAKQRNNLKTVHPQTLNWQMEEVKEGPKPRFAEDTLGLMTPASSTACSLKPALKKLNIADMWIREVNQHLQGFSPAVLATHRQPRLRFNHQVEQCVAIMDEEEEEEEQQDDEGHSLKGKKTCIKMLAPVRLKRSQSDAASTLSEEMHSSRDSFHHPEEEKSSVLGNLTHWFIRLHSRVFSV
ncbi:hypothetical protein EC973_009480 [Apophysomyces ossiformis]|uniref:Nitrogen regulatory protein areA GATA-like domain-containing protein n=1 Tax=Apophysomyces ossiformis TaxID=679940 RepID=A0A8H7BVL2_9FUNG|nr:hypothetical protein EC973_009480 [Apophysomyces ossiformis]